MSAGGRWFRVNTTWSQSEWLAVLPPASRLAWIELIGYVKAHGYDGKVREVSPVVFGRMFGIDAADVATLIDAAQADGALEVSDGQWSLTGWKEHQGDPTAKARMKRYRGSENKSEVTEVARNDHSVTPTETRTETRTETDIPIAKAIGAGGPVDETESEPEPTDDKPAPKAEWDLARATLAPLIREHVWQSSTAPRLQQHRGLTMARELTVCRQLLKQYTLAEVAGGIGCFRAALGIPPGQPMTLLWFNADGRRNRFEMSVGHWRAEASSGGDWSDIDRLLNLGDDDDDDGTEDIQRPAA